jgi:hypothetical protein
MYSPLHLRTATDPVSETCSFQNTEQWTKSRSIGLTTPKLEKTLVIKAEEATTRYFSWQKLLRKARAHVGLSSQ